MQKRLLFVDDEELIRDLYASLDTIIGADHEIRTAADGREALQLIQEKPFDVIVSDLAMPQMNGLEFLHEVVQSHPESARIVISGFADRIKVAECLTVGHRFFSKPFNVKTLANLLQRICQYNYLVQDERVRKIVCGSKALPTPPATYLRLTDLLNSKYSDLEDIARLVEQDAGLSTKLIHIVNSAQFGIGREIVSPGEAIQLLGIEVLRALMLGTQVFNFYDQSPFVRLVFGELWSHSLRTAVGARKLAVSEGLAAAVVEECFLAGLLHDIGKLILAANSETEYQLVLDLVKNKGLSLYEAEMGIYGSTHAQVGAYLLALWGVPDNVIKAVELHHCLPSADIQSFNAVLAIHIAQTFDPAEPDRRSLDEGTLARLELLDRVPAWKETVGSED